MKWLLLLLLSLPLFSLEIDIPYLKQKLKENPNDTKTMLILSRYYLDHNQTKEAIAYSQQILHLEPHNEVAKKLLTRAKSMQKIKELLHNQSIPETIEKLYRNDEYTKLLQLAKLLQKSGSFAKLDDDTLYKIARVAMWQGEYQLAFATLQQIKNRDRLDYYQIKGYSCLYTNDLECAKKSFRLLFDATGEKEYGKRLLETLLQAGDIHEAKSLLLTLRRTFKSDAELENYASKFQEEQNRYLQQLHHRYKEKPIYEHLEPYAMALYGKDPKKAIALLRSYLAAHPNDEKAATLLAKLLAWNQQYNEALQLLQRFLTTTSAKLLFGQILAWKGEYDKAIPYLLEVMQNGSNKERYEAKKTIAFIYQWQNKKAKAKQLFSELAMQNPYDQEVQEALDILEGKVKKWENYYEKLLKKDPKNGEYLLKLAQFNQILKNRDKAITYYERYLQLKPQNLQIHKTLGDLYLQKKEFYKGFGHFEYYANLLDDPQAYYQLAQRYYWYGFNKEALKVIDELLKKDPDYKEAIELKAKILKIDPRFLLTKDQDAIEGYFQKRAQKLLILGDRLYFNNLYEGAIDYYRRYLQIDPENATVRERYAYALEYAQKYAQAAGEFYILLWSKKDPLITYHYAYNLLKSGKSKEAKKILQQLLHQLPQPLPDFLERFLQAWKAAWESLDIERYAKFYDKRHFGKRWKLKKEALFQKNSFVAVSIYDPQLLKQEGNLYIVEFFQVYASKLKKDKGYKKLWIRCNKKKECRIEKEEWRAGTYKPKKRENLRFFIQKLLRQTPQALNLHDKSKRYKDILLATALSKDIMDQKSILNIATLYSSNVLPPVSSDYRQGDVIDRSTIFFSLSTTLFRDNQGINAKDYHISFGKKVYDNFWIAIQKDGYRISDRGKSASGYDIALRLIAPKGEFRAIYDKNGDKSRFGFETEYDFNFIHLYLYRKNAIYTKKTYCSKDLMQTGIALSKSTLLGDRPLWSSIELAHIKKDFEKTVQFDYAILSKDLRDLNLTLSLNGWYQFHSKTTKCYYAPQKIDNTLFAVKSRLRVSNIVTTTRVSAGYSFWERSFLYNLGLEIAPFRSSFSLFHLICEYSNSSATNTAQDYRSFQCLFDIRKFL